MNGGKVSLREARDDGRGIEALTRVLPIWRHATIITVKRLVGLVLRHGGTMRSDDSAINVQQCQQSDDENNQLASRSASCVHAQRERAVLKHTSCLRFSHIASDGRGRLVLPTPIKHTFVIQSDIAPNHA